MIQKRNSEDRGHANHGWLETNHSFSFGNYYNPDFTHFGQLRVMNDDIIQPGKGFGTHPHDNMEIITYMVDGAIRHEDSMGNSEVLGEHMVQRMSAGSGITHSEFNASNTEETRLLQIWVIPDQRGYEPRYEDRTFDPKEKQGKLKLIVSPDGRDGSFDIHQDVRMYASILKKGEAVSHSFDNGRSGWLQVVNGRVTINGEEYTRGDAAIIREESEVTITSEDNSEFLLFDLVE